MNWYSEIATDYDYDTVMQKEKKKKNRRNQGKKNNLT